MIWIFINYGRCIFSSLSLFLSPRCLFYMFREFKSHERSMEYICFRSCNCVCFIAYLVTDNGVGDHHQQNNHHQYQPLARHQAKVESHKSACVKVSSQLSSPSTPTAIIPSSIVCTSSSVTLPTSSTGLPTGKICRLFLSFFFALSQLKQIPQKFIYSSTCLLYFILLFSRILVEITNVFVHSIV